MTLRKRLSSLLGERWSNEKASDDIIDERVLDSGNRGLGKGMTEALAQANASVAIIYHSSKDAHDVAAELAKKWDAKINAYQCDVGDQAKVRETFKKIEADMGQIHGLIAVSTPPA